MSWVMSVKIGIWRRKERRKRENTIFIQYEGKWMTISDSWSGKENYKNRWR
jgi:hypothetical protein